MTTKLMIIAALLLTIAVASVRADEENAQAKKEPQPNPMALFQRLDTNNNGVIDQAEFMAGQKRMKQAKTGKDQPKGKARGKNTPMNDDSLKKYDTDSDGKLSKDERKAMMEDRRKNRGLEE